jgi:hypothetical protein
VHSGGAADRGCDLGGDGIGARLRGNAIPQVTDSGITYDLKRVRMLRRFSSVMRSLSGAV